jgi:SAM-dependent methyltransferase
MSMDTRQPVATWHHGLVARWWALFNEGGEEVDFFGGLVQERQPVLDVGCGAGRLLVPWAVRGIDVDGVDATADMIAASRAACAAADATPRLEVQPAHLLDLPRRYGSIVMCGVFGLGATRTDDVQALRRAFDHLDPGGLLAIDLEVGEFSSARWQEFRERPVDESEPPAGDRRRGSDGCDYALRARVVSLDAATRSAVREIQAWQWRDGALVGYETHRLVANLWERDELVAALADAGFVDVRVVGGYHGDEPTGDERFLVYLATRP